MTGLYAVCGRPILHSRSPDMHNAAFRARGIDAAYVRLAAESAKAALESALGMGISGLNITSPFKEDFAGMLRTKDEAARRLGAVNTVAFKDGSAIGYNTDPHGVIGALKSNGLELRDANAVVLGAGGAARAAALALSEEGAHVTVANRTLEKAAAIAEDLLCEHSSIGGLGMKEADILISALSTAERVIPRELLREGLVVLEANYSEKTALMRDASEAGCTTISGLEWLLHQGARAFEIFTGKKAPIEEMRRAMYPKHGAGKMKSCVSLIGMMGSGKDTVASEMARIAGMGRKNVDADVERKAGKAINAIFAEEGEEAFREMERKEIANIRGLRKTVINCGGGAILDEKSRETIKRNSTVVWLYARPAILAERVGDDASRPLLEKAGGERARFLDALQKSRLGAYAKASDLVIDSGSENAAAIAERILYEVHKTGKG